MLFITSASTLLRPSASSLDINQMSTPDIHHTLSADPAECDHNPRSRLKKSRGSVWGQVPTLTGKIKTRAAKCSAIGSCSEEAGVLPPQFPTVPMLERIESCIRRSSSFPTREINLFASIVTSPRACHLLPMTPGRLTEDDPEIKGFQFSYRLFKRVKKINRKRFNAPNSGSDETSMAFLFDSSENI